jgi:hypothetical protein
VKPVVKKLIEDEIGNTKDNLYRARMQAGRNPHDLSLKSYIRANEARLSELQEALEETR